MRAASCHGVTAYNASSSSRSSGPRRTDANSREGARRDRQTDRRACRSETERQRPGAAAEKGRAEGLHYSGNMATAIDDRQELLEQFQAVSTYIHIPTLRTLYSLRFAGGRGSRSPRRREIFHVFPTLLRPQRRLNPRGFLSIAGFISTKTHPRVPWPSCFRARDESAPTPQPLPRGVAAPPRRRAAVCLSVGASCASCD